MTQEQDNLRKALLVSYNVYCCPQSQAALTYFSLISASTLILPVISAVLVAMSGPSTNLLIRPDSSSQSRP